MDTYRSNGDKVVRSDRIKNKYMRRGKSNNHQIVATQKNLDNVNGFTMFHPCRNLV